MSVQELLHGIHTRWVRPIMIRIKFVFMWYINKPFLGVIIDNIKYRLERKLNMY